MSRARAATYYRDGEAVKALVAAARARSWSGPESAELLEDVLPDVADPVADRFPKLVREDVFDRAWELLQKEGFAKAESPLGWLRTELRFASINAVGGQEDLTDEGKVHKPEWQEARAWLWVKPDELAVVSGPDAERRLAEVEAPPAPRAAVVWEELRWALAQLLWPMDVLDACVEVLESRAELASPDDGSTEEAAGALAEPLSGAVSMGETVLELRELKVLPHGFPERLARFAFGWNGFLWAMLHGADRGRALRQDGVREQLKELVWPPDRA